jgi:hypothetical protein
MGQGLMGAAARWLRQSLRTGLMAAAACTLWATAQAQSAGGTAGAEPVLKGAYPPPPGDLPLDPSDIDVDLANSFPQPGSIFPSLELPGRDAYVKFKEDLYRDHGIRFGGFYSQLYQHASDTRPRSPYNSANGYWAALQFSWTALNRGTDHEGSLVVNLGSRNSIGNNAVPAGFGVPNLGSAWSNYEFTSWDTNSPKVEDLFWEQWLGRDFSFRVGNQIPTAVMNFSRFKDARVSFTSSPFAFHEIIPYPTFGLGASFRWRPLGESEFYVMGTLNDMNGEPAANGLDWSTFFDEKQFFYGTEFGYRWRRPNGEFDHVHLNLFWADERITRNAATTPNKAGGGLRVYGEKQFGPYVAFGGYTYNTAEGGGISATVTRQLATAGLAYVNPLNVRGELALGLMWTQPIRDIFPGSGQRNQTGWELYWRMLVTPNLWITPGVQVVYNPSFNPGVDTIYIPDIKFRLSF